MTLQTKLDLKITHNSFFSHFSFFSFATFFSSEEKEYLQNNLTFNFIIKVHTWSLETWRGYLDMNSSGTFAFSSKGRNFLSAFFCALEKSVMSLWGAWPGES